MKHFEMTGIDTDPTADEAFAPTPPGGASEPQPLIDTTPQAGTVGLRAVPGYTVAGIIGEGGMGAVYEAQQHKPARRGALKFILPGAVTPRSIRRFEHEHEVLARLQHPGIAAIYAAGLHDGTPSLATTGACWGRPGQKNVTVQFVHVINFDACRLGGVAGYPN